MVVLASDDMDLKEFVAAAIAREIERQLSGSVEGRFARATEIDEEKLAVVALAARKQWCRATDPSIRD